MLRNGERQEILAEQLVPGDWVILQSGDKAPADLRLVDTKNLRIQEAVLTGEAEAVEKNPAPDDHFASIIHAVEEGRTVYDNLRKAILFILPTNGAQALVIIAAILLGMAHLPVTPVQILWVNHSSLSREGLLGSRPVLR